MEQEEELRLRVYIANEAKSNHSRLRVLSVTGRGSKFDQFNAAVWFYIAGNCAERTARHGHKCSNTYEPRLRPGKISNTMECIDEFIEQHCIQCPEATLLEYSNALHDVGISYALSVFLTLIPWDIMQISQCKKI